MKKNVPISPCLQPRRKVFVAEQGFSEELEFDDIDQTAWHIVLTSRGKPVGTGRLFVRNPNRPSVFTIGRLAVLRNWSAA